MSLNHKQQDLVQYHNKKTSEKNMNWAEADQEYHLILR